MKTLVFVLWLIFIICLFLMWFFSQRAKHKERVMMIERGMNPDETEKRDSPYRFLWSRIGAIIIGLSIGLIIIAILTELKLFNEGETPLMLGILGICGGLGMAIGNKFNDNKNKD